MVMVVTTYRKGDPTIKECIRTFCEFWPKRYKMTAYYEGEDSPVCPTGRGIDLTEKQKDRVSFLPISNIPNLEAMREALDNETYRNKDWRFNAYGWMHKALVLGHTGMMSNERFIWIDADVVTFNTIPEDFIERAIPDKMFMTLLGRNAMSNPKVIPYTETGFLAFDASHPMANNFFAFYLNAWFTFAFRFLCWWTDSHVLDYTRHVLEAPTLDLTAKLPQPCPGDHVFVHSMVGQYMDHLKGNRKELGYSPEHPLKWWRDSGRDG